MLACLLLVKATDVRRGGANRHSANTKHAQQHAQQMQRAERRSVSQPDPPAILAHNHAYLFTDLRTLHPHTHLL
jgi:hypothetical protein